MVTGKKSWLLLVDHGVYKKTSKSIISLPNAGISFCLQRVMSAEFSWII